MEDKLYKQKYLKYKAKYLNLKEIQTGGITAKTGTYIYVFPTYLKEKMKVNNYKPGILSIKYLSTRDISTILNNIGYECKVGEKKMTIVRSTDSKIAERAKHAASVAGTGIKHAASVAGTGIKHAASVAGTGIKHAASVAGTGISHAAQSVGNKLGESLIKTGESMRTVPPQPALARGESIQPALARGESIQPNERNELETELDELTRRELTRRELTQAASGGATPIPTIELSKSSDLNDIQPIIKAVATKLEVAPNTLCCIAVRMNALTANTIVLFVEGDNIKN
jgi:hypothetical protein